MTEFINKMIFPAPDASYSITTRNPGARLVHIRRSNNTQRFTVGYYLSPTLMKLDLARKQSQKPTTAPKQCAPSSNSCVDDDGATDDHHPVSKNSREKYAAIEANGTTPSSSMPSSGASPPTHLLLYAHPNACDIGMLVGELQYVSEVCNIDVLIWEFRGYGLCGAGDPGVEPSEMDLYQDMEATFDFATKTLGYPAGRIILCGRSIGSGPTVQLASYLPRKFRRGATQEEVATGGGPLAGVMLQCPFTSIQDSVDSLIDINASKFTKGLFSGSMKSVARAVVSDRFRSVDSIEHIFWPREDNNGANGGSSSSSSSSQSSFSTSSAGASALRLVFQHGNADSIVPHSHSQQMVERIRSRLAKHLGLSYPFPRPATPPSAAPPSSSSSSTNGVDPVFYNLMGRHLDGGASETPSNADSTRKLSPEEATLKEALDEMVHFEVCKGEGHNDLSVETMAEVLMEHIVEPSCIHLRSQSNNPRQVPTAPFDHVEILVRLESYCTASSFFWKVYAIDAATAIKNAGGEAPEHVPGVDEEDATLTTLGEWTRVILPNVFGDLSGTLRAFGKGGAPLLGGNASGPTHLCIQDLCQVHPKAQHRLSHVLTASFCAFMNHVAIRWLRAKRLSQLRPQHRTAVAERHSATRGLVEEYHSINSPSSSDATMEDTQGTSSVGGGAPVDPTTVRSKRGNPLSQTTSLAALTRDTTVGFILEHMALYGSPLGIYLLPNMNLSAAEDREPSPTASAAGDDEAANSASSIPSFAANPNIVAFGGLIHGSELFGSGDVEPVRRVPYRCWYTHSLFDNTVPPVDVLPGRPQSSSAATTATRSASTSFASSRKMKRLTERLPRVPLFECEVSNNLLVLVKEFLDSLKLSESGLENLNEFELNDLCGVVAVERTALRLSERQVDKIQLECERIILALLEEAAREERGILMSSGMSPQSSPSSPSSSSPPLRTSILSTLLKPVLRFISKTEEASTSTAARGGDDILLSGRVDEDGLFTELYLPNDLYTETLPMPIVISNRLLSALESDFAREYYSTTGDLEMVTKDVSARLQSLIAERGKAGSGAVVIAPNDDDLEGKLQGGKQDSFASMLFSLLGALLRNSPEGLVGAVGDTTHFPTFDAVRLLTTIHFRHYLPDEALRPSPSTITDFVPPPRSNILAPLLTLNAPRPEFVNRVLAPAMVGGRAGDIHAYLKQHLGDPPNTGEKDKLTYIKVTGKTSASGSSDCVIM